MTFARCDVCGIEIEIDEDNYYKCTNHRCIKRDVYLCTKEECAWKGKHGDHDKDLYFHGIRLEKGYFCIMRSD